MRDKMAKKAKEKTAKVKKEEVVEIKEEIAEEMFFKGIAYVLDHMNNLKEIDINRIKGKIDKII